MDLHLDIPLYTFTKGSSAGCHTFLPSFPIPCLNVESISELLVIEKIAKSKNKKVDIGIRLNPNTNPKTLKQISTGKEGDKFEVKLIINNMQLNILNNQKEKLILKNFK